MENNLNTFIATKERERAVRQGNRGELGHTILRGIGY